VVGVYQGNVFGTAAQRCDWAGDQTTQYLQRILRQSGVHLHDMCTVQRIKEEVAYVSMDYDAEVDNFDGKEKLYELPDSSVITVHNQLIRCQEILFQPQLCGGLAEDSVTRLIKKSLDDTNMFARKDFWNNVMLCGGATMTPNFPERLQQELGGLKGIERPKVIAPPERMISSWIGGSVMASLSMFHTSRGISVQNGSRPGLYGLDEGYIVYDEIGPRAVHMLNLI